MRAFSKAEIGKPELDYETKVLIECIEDESVWALAEIRTVCSSIGQVDDFRRLILP